MTDNTIQVPVEGQITVHVIVLETEIPGLDGAAARNKDGRRGLDRLGPTVHVAQLGVTAVKRKWLGLTPCPHNELVSLRLATAGRGRDRAVSVVRIHRRTDGKSRK